MSGDRIGPTAHYTAAVWHANGLSPRELATRMGRAMYRALGPINAIYARTGHGNLEQMLLDRHHRIDAALRADIERGAIGQVLELAAGLSGRGLRLTARYPELTYLESDLPAMAARKRAALERAGATGRDHRVVDIDVLAAGDIDAALASLDPGRGVAVITEGLIPYLPTAAVADLWRRIAAGLRRFPTGVYLTDLNLRADLDGMRAAAAVTRVLRVLVRGEVQLHHATAREAAASLREAGFREVRVEPEDAPGGPPTVRVARAQV